MPSIYAADLAAYNNGTLHGCWIDLDGKDADDVWEEIAAMLRASPCPTTGYSCPECGGDGRVLIPAEIDPYAGETECETCGGIGQVSSAEEWAVHDYDGLPGSFGEHPDLSKVIAYVEALDEVGEANAEAFADWFEDDPTKTPDAEEFFGDYIGHFNDWEDLAASLMDETGGLSEIPEHLRSYFDYNAYGRDLRISGDVWESEGHYFWSR